jgi:branched-chain amino acid transport system ATP-binding protein
MLDVDAIDVSYGDLQALWGISFNVQEREIVVLIGPNGAGKTTILRTLSGLLRPSAGRIVFSDHHLDKTSAHKIVELGLSHVPEGRALFPGMTVLENLELGAYAREARKVRQESLSFVFEILPILNHRSNQLAGTLSGGGATDAGYWKGLDVKT